MGWKSGRLEEQLPKSDSRLSFRGCSFGQATMSYKDVDASTTKPYTDPTPMPSSVPHVQELGVTSAPLKSAAFFIGSYCKDYNGIIATPNKRMTEYI